MLSVKTGISPLDLLATPGEILDVMVEHVFGKHTKTGSSAWEDLAAMAIE